MRGMLGGDVDGVLAQYVLLDQHGVVRIPDSLGFEAAATLPCAAVTAWSALHVGPPLLTGQPVLVQGSGGPSNCALQLARRSEDGPDGTAGCCTAQSGWSTSH